MEFYYNISAIHTKWCASSFPLIFRLFAIINCIFAKIVAPTSNKNENHLAHLKGNPFRKKLVPWGTDGRLPLSGVCRSLYRVWHSVEHHSPTFAYVAILCWIK